VKLPITAWIVEDNLLHAREAWEAISQVSSEFTEDVRIFWADDPSWDSAPAFRNRIDIAEKSDADSGYPDLVILDLMFGTENAEAFLADVFHERLRRWEASKAGKPAFVVLWSVHQGALDTEKFVTFAVSSDPRIIETGSKRSELLKPKLRQLWRRIIEEREDRVE